jgi:hypothetical protein
MDLMAKQKRLVNLLLTKTQAGEVDWKVSPLNEAFQLSFRNKSVRIRKAESEVAPDAFDYTLEILNFNGQLVEAFSDDDLGGDYYNPMRSLHEMARRTALGTEKLLTEILDELEGEIPF